MTRKKLGSKKTISHDQFQITCSTLNSLLPKTIDINISGWAWLKDPESETDIQRELQRLDKRIRQRLFQLVANHQTLKPMYVVDQQSASGGYSKNFKTYYSVDITIFQKDYHKTYPKFSSVSPQEVCDAVIPLLQANETFGFQKNKPAKPLLSV
jgi:hypothetical protein